MPDEILKPAESSEYDELTEDLKAIGAFRDRNTKEYHAAPEQFLAKRRSRRYPGFILAAPGQHHKTKPQ